MSSSVISHYCAALLVILLSCSRWDIQVACLPQRMTNFQHIAVVENAAWERTLPSEFQNPFYKTPRVREALAKSSWFGPGENVVLNREAEKISRMEIYNVLSHAGLISRHSL